MVRSIVLSLWFYRRLLRLYPRGYQRQFGRDQTLVFRDLCADAHRRRGIFGVLALWMPEAFAVLRSSKRVQIEPARPLPASSCYFLGYACAITVLMSNSWAVDYINGIHPHILNGLWLLAVLSMIRLICQMNSRRGNVSVEEMER